MVLRTDRSYAKGDEVYVSYGQKTSSSLLLSYGFIPAAGGGGPGLACIISSSTAWQHTLLHAGSQGASDSG